MHVNVAIRTLRMTRSESRQEHLLRHNAQPAGDPRAAGNDIKDAIDSGEVVPGFRELADP